MRFWISHASEVPIRDQLATQISLAILSDDLKPGTRLPSTRELARRFRIHANTVSAAYRDLEKDGWLQLRRGSGVYVRENPPTAPPSPELALEQLIAGLHRSARKLGLPLAVVRSRLRQSSESQPPDHFLLIEPSRELAEIVIAEIRGAVKFPVKACDLRACTQPETLQGAIPIVLPSKSETVRGLLPSGMELLCLRLQSITDSMAPWTPVRGDSLVGVASAWPDFLKRARIMLVAAGFHPHGLLFRDAARPGWTKGLAQAAAVVCDSLTATQLPANCRAIPFALVAESSLDELRRYEQFIVSPLS